MEKKILCPKCNKITTCNGNPGEVVLIKCQYCGAEGKVTFQKTEAPSSKKLVAIKNISKRYKDLLAVNNISFDINQGEIFGYIGPNGAGKTTTIKMMVGLLKQTNGNIFINDYKMPEQKQKAHKFIGYLPQQVAFQQWRTLNHALTTFGKLSGMDKNSIQPRIDELLKILDLNEYKFRKVGKLSGGTIQKAGIVQALMHNPSLLILDEPLNGLDPESRFQVKQILRDLSKKGTTVFFSSHILSDVQDVATKICILDWGKIIKIGSMDQLKYEFLKQSQIELVLSKKSDKFNEINKISGVKNIIEKSSKRFLIDVEKTADIDETVHEIIKNLLKNNSRIKSITPTSPNLDEIYQYYLRKGVNM